MLALSIRQPWAELILRGIKTVEFRSRPTRIIGERFFIYAAKGKGSGVGGQGSAIERRKIWSRDLALPSAPPKEWMIELCEKLILDKLPTGVIVGSAIVSGCERIRDQMSEVRSQMSDGDASLTSDLSSSLSLRAEGRPLTSVFAWHLADVRREGHRKPERHPQPVWFKPF